MRPTFVMASNGKYHSFSLASALDRQQRLVRFFTVYHSQKDQWARRWSRREDREPITLSRVETNVWTELPLRVGATVPMIDRYSEYAKAIWLDRWVARHLVRESADVFMGWSNSSVTSLAAAKSRGMRTIVTRGSAHISVQSQILTTEYTKRGLAFAASYGIERRELEEYRLADYIRIPSSYVRKTFVDQGVPATKLMTVPYAVDTTNFSPQPREAAQPFRVLLLNATTVRKGFFYAAEMIEALNRAGSETIEFWIIGDTEPVIRPAMHRLLASHANVKAWDRINHYELARWISQCDVAVFPTVEEGFGNTIPQTMACGVPVIATANSCARDVVADGVEGFVVPAMDLEPLVEKVQWCLEHRDRLREMGQAALTRMRRRTWDDVVAEIIDGLSPARHSMAVAG